MRAWSLSCGSVHQFTDINEVAGYRGSGGHGRAHQMGTSTKALTAFEVPVGGRRTMLALPQLIGVHRQTHRATRITPFKTGFDKDLVQAFLLRLGFHQTGTRHYHRLLQARRHLAAFHHRCGFTQVFNTAIGAGTDKHPVQLDVGNLLVRLQTHVFQRTHNAFTLDGIFFLRRVRHIAVDTGHHLRRRTPAHLRLDSRTVQLNHFVEYRIIVAVQRAPVFNGLIPGFAFRRERTTFHVVDGGVIHRHHTHTGTALNGHVADGHTAFHAQATDCLTTKLDGVTGTACGTDLADDGQDHILASHACAKFAVHLHQHVLHLFLNQALGSQNVLNFRGTDTVGQATKGAVSRGMGIPTHNAHARQGRTLLRPDHVDDALTLVLDLEFQDPEFVAVLVQGFNLGTGHRVHNTIDACFTIGGRNVMVPCRDVGINPPGFSTRNTKALECLRRGYFVQQLTVDVNQRGAVVPLFDQMVVPQLVV